MNNNLVIFERQSGVMDYFVAEVAEWAEVARAYVKLSAVIQGQRGEFVEDQQTKSQRRSMASMTWTPTLSQVDTACRMKMAKPIPELSEDLNNDRNYRIFHIDQIVNVGEENRELQMNVVEMT